MLPPMCTVPVVRAKSPSWPSEPVAWRLSRKCEQRTLSYFFGSATAARLGVVVKDLLPNRSRHADMVCGRCFPPYIALFAGIRTIGMVKGIDQGASDRVVLPVH